MSSTQSEDYYIQMVISHLGTELFSSCFCMYSRDDTRYGRCVLETHTIHTTPALWQ